MSTVFNETNNIIMNYPTKFSKNVGMIIGCDEEGRKKCRGLCCRKAIGYGRYEEDEVDKLPKELRKKLLYKNGEYLVPIDGDACSFINECLKNPDIKPRQCWLFPFKVSKKGTLYIHRYGWLNCPNGKKGTVPLYV